ncbi:MAG: hypothetical protein Q9186_001304 [Xanthomendoza sp. 1 TL-2023]
MTTPNSESSDSNPRKRMRKGTHSCLECRRRKIRCIYDSDATTCTRCISKRLHCVEQEYGDAKALGADKRKSMREKTSELEGMISQILTRLDTHGATTGPQDAEAKAAEALRCLRMELLPSTTMGADVLAQGSTGLASPTSEVSDAGHDGSRHFHDPPVLSLFDNAILSKGNERHDGDLREAGTTSQQPSADKNRRVLTALQTLIPSHRDIGLILRGSRQSPQVWQDSLRDCSHKVLDNFDQDRFQMTQEFIQGSLRSENLSVVARTFACLAITIQQLPGSFDFSTLHLPASPEALQDHYITAVETLMASDDGIGSTMDGLSCLIVQTKYYVNLGKPRKGWLTIRRALNFAHMLGFHRQSYGNGDAATISRRSIWLSIYQVERFLSLLLGYPSACLDSHFEGLLAGDSSDPAFDQLRFNVKLSVITGQIINRNQDPKSMTVAVTLKIDQDLEDAQSLMPQSWWNTAPTEFLESNTFDTLMARSFFHNIRMLLHLPFMLKSSTDRRYEYSRIAALGSSREMINNYHCIRHPARPLIAVCNVIDFQAFTAAMLLTINLLGGNFDSSDIDSNTYDWSLIQSLIADLEQVVKGGVSRGTNSVAAQALTVLQDLTKPKEKNNNESDELESYQAIIPYFGKIRIRWGRAVRNNRKTNSSSTTSSMSPSDSTTTAGHMPPTPSDSSTGTPMMITNLVNEGYGDGNGNGNGNSGGETTKFTFDSSYFQPLPPGGEAVQGWQYDMVDWSAINDFELLNDWSWFAGAQGQGQGQGQGDGGQMLGNNIAGGGGGMMFMG